MLNVTGTDYCKLFICFSLRFAFGVVFLMTAFLKIYPISKIRNIPIYRLAYNIAMYRVPLYRDKYRIVRFLPIHSPTNLAQFSLWVAFVFLSDMHPVKNEVEEVFYQKFLSVFIVNCIFVFTFLCSLAFVTFMFQSDGVTYILLKNRWKGHEFSSSFIKKIVFRDLSLTKIWRIIVRLLLRNLAC